MQHLTPATFVAKWKHTKLSERAASQEHFIDLCRLLGQPTPAEHDATGAEYTFEKGITIAQATASAPKEGGFADVWWNGKFGWEYKRKDKHKTLDEAYAQLQRYREALNNPPLLIVSDISRIEIHTNFNNTVNETIEISLDDIADGPGVDKLRHVFTNPEFFRPKKTTEQVTLDVAQAIGKIAQRLQKKHDPHVVAHFLMKCMFCLFAEDVPGLLPEHLFKNLLNRNRHEPERFAKLAGDLFRAMATGGDFGADKIPYFNGGLFDDAPPIELSPDDLGVLDLAANQDWAHIEPSILGTLFERSLDPSKRAQIGAHYTSKEDILLVINPVIMDPLRKEWQKLKAEIEAKLLGSPISRLAVAPATPPKSPRAHKSSQLPITNPQLPPSPLTPIHQQLSTFLAQLASLKILDPACGSGNFLYVAIQQLLTLEKEVITFAAQPPISLRLLPRIRPTQLLGIEINPYAAELAQVSIWIGFLQWLHLNGFPVATDTPILSKIQTIENRDAILDFNPPLKSEISNLKSVPLATPAQWPDAHFIIGNPPFLGSKLFRKSGLSDDYLSALYQAYDLPKTSDLCCYWFELARRKIEFAKSNSEISEVSNLKFEISLPRAGLLATQGIRGGDNRTVLERIKNAGDIFMAWSDREWILDGAMVHTSIIGFDSGLEDKKYLDGQPTKSINVDLSSGLDSTGANHLESNKNISFQGPVKVGEFDIDLNTARKYLTTPNPSPVQNTEVIREWLRGEAINQRVEPTFIIDFEERELNNAAQFEAPFEHARKFVKPSRDGATDKQRRTYWWRLGRSGSDFKAAIERLTRYLATCQTAKHRIFVWAAAPSLPAQTVIAFARSDEYFLGILHSAIHEVWVRAMGTQLREEDSGSRYTPTTCFETFPLPWPPSKENTKHPAYKRIAAAAKELSDLRERWLNPPELLAPLAQILDATDKFLDVPPEARLLIRHSALMAQAAQSPNLKKRTLTNLYNERPTWLKLAHEKLDPAVLAAYNAIDPQGQWSEDWAALYTETGAGTPLPDSHPDHAARLATDQKILTNLLRLNHERAST